MRDYRVWWALFVFFAAVCVLVIQSRYRRWRGARRLLQDVPGARRSEQARLLRLEGWRLLLMTVSLLAMTGLVFAVLLDAPAPVLGALRVLALLAVVGLVMLSVLA